MNTISIHSIVFVSFSECFASKFHTEIIFDKQLLSWLRNSATPLRLDYMRAISWYLQLMLVNHFRTGLVQKRRSKYGLNSVRVVTQKK